MTPACSMRRSPTCRLVSLNVPEASTATYASSPLPTAVIAGKAAQTSSEMPAKISFLRPVASMARATRASSKALTEERSMIDARQRFDEFGERRTPHTVARRRGNDDGELQRLGRFGQGYHVVLQLPGRVITDAGHETDLMIDEDERCIFESEGLVIVDLIVHCILLYALG